MQKLVFIFVFLFLFIQIGFSQHQYFILIKSDQQQPFYVWVGGKNQNSSAVGHILLSNLKDSVYNITIGFPQNRFPEQNFVVRVNQKDRGMQLKYIFEKGWVLFDQQTSEIVEGERNQNNKTSVINSGVKKENDFAMLMANVVNDTAVLYSLVAAEKKSPLTPITSSQQESKSKLQTEKIMEEANREYSITIVEEHATFSGYSMLIVDGFKDSIRIFIPVETDAEKNELQKDTSAIESITHHIQKQNYLLYPDTAKNNHTQIDLSSTNIERDTSISKAINPNCKAQANENDVDKVRVKMLSEKEDDEKIIIAKKIFKSKCLTTRQAKALSELFVNDEGKYKFFDAVYPFVQDPDNFKDLIVLLTDEYYIKRFKVMIRVE